MNNFITKLEDTVDLEQFKQGLEKILLERPWPAATEKDLSITNQIGLRHRPGASNKWLDASGGSRDNQQGKSESDFTEWNTSIPPYMIETIEALAVKYNFKIGRVRVMRLMPKSGLTSHKDPEKRIHLVLSTNKGSYVATTGTIEQDDDFQVKGYHIPADSHFYEIDTRLEHFVYNSGTTERIHLVINCLN
jgi:hypothetical protein